MDFDQEEESGQQQALPVADFDNFDPSKPPVTGEEYLRRVQLEANNCPATVVADIETSQYDDNRNSFTNSTEPVTLPSIFSIQIQETLAKDFNTLHNHLENLRWILEERKELKEDDTSQVPSVSDYNYWKLKCLGETVSIDCESSSDSQSSSTENRSQFKKSGTPSVNQLLALSQEDLLQLLEYQSKWITQYGFCEQNALWIYSILSCLQSPLNCDAYSLLRTLARAILKKVTCSKEEIPKDSSISSHLIICVIARCFNQWDLIQS